MEAERLAEIEHRQKHTTDYDYQRDVGELLRERKMFVEQVESMATLLLQHHEERQQWLVERGELTRSLLVAEKEISELSIRIMELEAEREGTALTSIEKAREGSCWHDDGG